MEAVRGLEFATFGQESADRVPSKATTLAFTRNAFDPMDFTPVCFTEYDNFERVTGNGAELAMAVLFLSGVQHYAETPAYATGHGVLADWELSDSQCWRRRTAWIRWPRRHATCRTTSSS